MSVLAIIPARAGSKGVPGKHLRMVGRKPLIQWTLEAVADSTLIDNAVVSTDDIGVLAQAESHPYIFLLDRRPPELAQDESPTEDVIAHVLKQNSDDILVLLQPTSPIRKGWQIDEAINLLIETRSDAVVSVVESHHLTWEYRGGLEPFPMYPPTHRPRRQTMDQYEENGNIYVFRRDMWEREHCRVGGRVALYEMTQAESLQIDTEFDLAIVDHVLYSHLERTYAHDHRGGSRPEPQRIA